MGTQTLSVNADANDGFWNGSSLTNNLILDIVGSNGGTCNCFHRFILTSTIPAGATITQCDFKPYSVDTVSDTFTYTAKFQNTTNASQPTSGTDLNGRSYTSGTAFVNTSMTSGAQYTHNLISELQSIVTGNTLTSGNGVMVACFSQASPTTNRRFSSKENSLPAQLIITWTDPPISITASAAGVFNTAGVLSVTRPITTSAAGTFVGGSAAIVNTRELTVTAAGSIGTGSPDRWFIYFPGWKDNGSGDFLFQSFGEDISVFWDGVDGASMVTAFQAGLDACPVTNGGLVTASLVSGEEPITIQVVYKIGPGGLNTATNVPEWSLIDWSHTGGSAPTLNVINDGGSNFNNVLRSFDVTAAGTFSGGDATLVDVGIQLTATAAGSFVGGDALLSLLVNITTTAAGVFNTTAAVSVYRPLTTSAAGSFTTADALLGTIVPVTMPGAAGSFATSTPSIVIYCRPFVRAQAVFHCTAHPDFVKPANTVAAGSFTTSEANGAFTRPVTAVGAATFNTAGHVGVARTFTASAAATFTTTATMGIPVDVTATAAGIFTTGTPLAETQRATTALAAAVFVTSSPTAKLQVTTTANGTFTATAFAGVKVRVTCSAGLTSATGSAVPTVTRYFITTNAGIFATVGGVGIVTSHTATAGATFVVTGQPSFKRRITAAAAGTFATNTPFASFVLRVNTAAAGSFTTSNADATNTRRIETSASVSIQTAAGIINTRQISVQSSLDVLTAGRLSLNRQLSIVADGVFSATGTITNTRKLTTNANGIFNSEVALSVYRPLSVVAGAYFGTKHVAPYVDPTILKDVWTMPPRVFVWVMPDSDN